MTPRTIQLQQQVEKVYEEQGKDLLFHGWHHVAFVIGKSEEFAAELGVDQEIIRAAAIVHDVNYIADPKSDVEAGAELREQYLRQSGFSDEEIARIEDIVCNASTKNRDAHISKEAQALSDADSLFKVLPISPIIFSSRYIQETGVDLHKWADRIVRDQKPLLEQDVYFYTKTARERYTAWAKLNLKLVETIQQSLDDPDIQSLLAEAKKAGVF